MRISDWSSDVCSSDLRTRAPEIAELVDAQISAPVLIVLPKWQTMAVPDQTQKPGWVSVGFPARPPVAMLPPAHFGQVAIEAAPGKKQQVPARLAGHSFNAWLPDNVRTEESRQGTRWSVTVDLGGRRTN